MKNLFDLTGKIALVTGASSGLGVQFAKALANQGASVAIAARRVEKLEKVKKEIEALGVKCLAIKCDVLVTSEIVDMVAKVKEHFGRIDILVNNAGVGKGIPADTQTDEEWASTLRVNCDSVYFTAREVGKVMIAQKYGRIINIGSIHSQVAMPNSPISAYCTSKGAVLMLTKALANEWAKYNITVNTIGPAYFPSEMTAEVLEDEASLAGIKMLCPMGRPGRDGELDGAVVYFASDASSYTTGQYLAVDGGWTAV
ncbi:SDR family oxidoreductase [Faecalicatena contorta]|uniref:Gluconate 5-dehydrogenase n=1 Tax=Faecalicatena contorta TaxID=39482 RepID=A0A315ZUE2_9FIRM|nr:SDR family oxidoreductase [Faecalicatena contorta]MBA4698349.1 SDR family oxidoreductase [Ruminococcus sp.]PWJ48560.1 gluconate 5-dehydrogenase [Faecalicatena contorta]SUQ15296.1 gluconate 5-dehydrogenase [Faecalicatena contorta]